MKILAMIMKEFLHILRDPRSLTIIIVMPILMLFLYGYALNLDLRDISLGIVDLDHSTTSRQIIDRFVMSGYFHVTARLAAAAMAEPMFRSDDLMAALVVPAGFERDLRAGQSPDVQILVDGSDPNIGTIILGYAGMIMAEFTSDLNPRFTPPLRIAPKIFFNEDLKSSYFFVPGLVAFILMMISALLTSITIAREKETGTMEQLLVAPIKPVQVIVGKVVPYIFLAFLDGILIVTVAHLWFRVPVRGDLLHLAAMTILYVTSCLSIGLLISTVTSTQQTAIMLALFTTMLPSIMLSGFIFPIASMPVLIQYITMLVPARYFMVIARGSMLKGLSVSWFMHELGFLAAFGLGLLILSALKFKKRLGES
ncbi:ABC transporter permease [bacterium]|nr:ABC transporter permease [candidate division CSSED10-310 bacterium]